MFDQLKVLPLLGFNVPWTYGSKCVSIEKSKHCYHYMCKAAANVKDATELIEAGYEYICDMDDVKLFRKRK